MNSYKHPLRVGVGGPVGSGKTALLEALSRRERRGSLPPLRRSDALFPRPRVSNKRGRLFSRPRRVFK